MEVSAALERLGGVATTAQLVALSSRRRLRVALRRGEITRVGRGRYASADATWDRTTAISLAGVTSHLSAARHWGWPVKWPPDRPWVNVRRKRHLDAETRAVVNVSYADLTPDEIVDGVTSPLRTVLDCARRLPFDEALAVADSALRAGAVTRAELVAAAARLRGRGATQARRVATPGPGGRLLGVPHVQGGALPGLCPLHRAGAGRVARRPVHLGAGDALAGVRPRRPGGARLVARFRRGGVVGAASVPSALG